MSSSPSRIHTCGCFLSDGKNWKTVAKFISIVVSVQSFGLDPVMTGFMVIMIGNDEHRRRRWMPAHPCSNSYILNSQTLDSTISRVSRLLRERMAMWASTCTTVDVYQQAKCCLLDVISGFRFGSENATDTLQDPSFENDLTTLVKATTKNLHVRTSLDGPMSFLTSLFGGNVLPDARARGRWEMWIT
ncbi:hypothetical protein BOTCAL_0387g00140 [Botryotinia calthae]|uniref:Uncharacterized protein n=1 Tax=Botryotinia calthae TaxID=38488 RepID=A0A4Y8CR78_9HELO|nr:hypothetical protein BOTCAL_0387g00140 [Botryotinia calthae]